MTIYSIIAGSFNGLIALILAVYIFAKNFRSRLNQIFGLFYSFIAIWSFNYALYNFSTYQNDLVKVMSGNGGPLWLYSHRCFVLSLYFGFHRPAAKRKNC